MAGILLRWSRARCPRREPELIPPHLQPYAIERILSIVMPHGGKIGLMAALIMAAWFMPQEAFGYEKDPYLRKSISGRIYLAYENYDTTYGNQRTKSSKFQQVYSLDTKGNLLSRRLIIYDAGATWDIDDNNVDSSNVNAQATRYYASTTLLPLSNIPLTLHWTTDTNTTSISNDKNTSTEYGLYWTARFRTLPVTRLNAYTAENNFGTFKSRTNNYSLDLEKDLGPTKNTVNYKQQNTTVDPGSTSSDQYTLNINNITNIGRSTTLTTGIAKSDATSTAGNSNTTSSTESVSLLLDSKPSDEFTQTHNYNFLSSKGSGTLRESSVYGGALGYSNGSNFSSSLNLNVDNSKAVEPTSMIHNKYLLNTAYVSIRLSNHWTANERWKIDTYKTSSTVPTANFNNHSIFNTLTSLNYTRPFKWVAVAAHYGVGYTKESFTQQPSGKGIAQDASFALGNINLFNYAGLNAATYMTRVGNTVGQRNSSSESYNLGVFNIAGRKYMALSSSYAKGFNKSWNTLYDTDTEAYSLIASSDYFKRTKLNYSLNSASSFNSITGVSKNTTNKYAAQHLSPILGGNFQTNLDYMTNNANNFGAISSKEMKSANMMFSREILKGLFTTNANYSAAHIEQLPSFRDDTTKGYSLSYSRPIFRGNFTASYKKSIQDSNSNTLRFTTTTTNIDASYVAILFRRVIWRANFNRETTETNPNNYFRYMTYYSNFLAYRLRQWSLVAEQSQRVTEDQTGLIVTENKILFKAERSFLRVF